MKKNIIIGLIFVVCLIFVGYISYYLGSKTVKPQVIETAVEKEPNVDEIKELLKNEIYDDAYNEGYEKGKTEVFELMLESENTEDIETESDSSTVNTEPIVSNQSATNQSNSSNDANIYISIDDEWTTDNRSDTPTDDYPGQPNDDGSYTIHNPTMSADSVTWSISSDGILPRNFWNKATANLHYYDYSYNDAQPISGFLISVTPDGPGIYTIHWSNSDGSLQCDQTVYLNE